MKLEKLYKYPALSPSFPDCIYPATSIDITIRPKISSRETFNSYWILFSAPAVYGKTNHKSFRSTGRHGHILSFSLRKFTPCNVHRQKNKYISPQT